MVYTIASIALRGIQLKKKPPVPPYGGLSREERSGVHCLKKCELEYRTQSVPTARKKWRGELVMAKVVIVNNDVRREHGIYNPLIFGGFSNCSELVLVTKHGVATGRERKQIVRAN
jgi:hypothetical protein